MKCECVLCPTPANPTNKKVYSSISQLEEHIIQVHVEDRSIDIDPSKKAISKKSALLWQCTQCSSIFVGPQDLEAHSKVHDVQNEKEIGNEIRNQTNTCNSKSEHQYQQPCLRSKIEAKANNELQLFKSCMKNPTQIIPNHNQSQKHIIILKPGSHKTNCQTSISNTIDHQVAIRRKGNRKGPLLKIAISSVPSSLKVPFERIRDLKSTSFSQNLKSRCDTNTGLRLGTAQTLETQQQEKLFQHQQPHKLQQTIPNLVIQNNSAIDTSGKAAPPKLLQNCSNSSSKPSSPPHAISTGSSVPLKSRPQVVDLTLNDPDIDSAEQDQDPFGDVRVPMELEVQTRQTEVDEPTYHLDPNLDYDPSTSYSSSGSTSPWNSNLSQCTSDEQPSSSKTIFHYYASDLQKPKRIYTKSTACLPLPLPSPGSGTVPNEVKIHRRKEANRKASIRYRKRQNAEMGNFLKTLGNLKVEHENLLTEKNKLAGEIKLVKSLLRDFLFARREKPCKTEVN